MAARTKEDRSLLIIIFLASFILRLLAAFYYYNFDRHAQDNRVTKPFLFSVNDPSQILPDIDRYNPIARDILRYGKIVQHDSRIPSVPPPIYPIFLAFFYFLFGYNIYAFFLPQIALASLTAALVFVLAQRLFSDKAISFAAGLLFALNPHFILIAIQPYSETLFFFLLLSLFLVLHNLIAAPGIKNALLASVLMALSVLCRSMFLVFIPFIFLWLAIVFFQEGKKFIGIGLGIFLCFVLVYGIWVARNYKVFNKLLFSINFSSAWVSNKPQKITLAQRYLDRYGDEASAFIHRVKNNPAQYAKLCLSRAKIFLFNPYYEGVSNRNKVVSSILFFLFYPPGVIGLFKKLLQNDKLAWLVLLYIASATVLHILTVVDGELRHRLPIELLLGICACYALSFRKQEGGLRSGQRLNE